MPDSDSTEIVKAGAEGAASGAISALIAPVSGFLQTLCGGTTEQLGGWAGDAVAFRRWKARVRMLERAECFLRASGRTPQEVPLPVLLPILDGGANEEDESMSDRWAALLANAAGTDDTLPPRFASILRDLSPRDAALLDWIVDWKGPPPPTTSKLSERFTWARDAAAFQLSVDTLEGLGTISTSKASVRPRPEPNAIHYRLPSLLLQPTQVGVALVWACRPPASSGR